MLSGCQVPLQDYGYNYFHKSRGEAEAAKSILPFSTVLTFYFTLPLVLHFTIVLAIYASTITSPVPTHKLSSFSSSGDLSPITHVLSRMLHRSTGKDMGRIWYWAIAVDKEWNLITGPYARRLYGADCRSPSMCNCGELCCRDGERVADTRCTANLPRVNWRLWVSRFGLRCYRLGMLSCIWESFLLCLCLH